ncbi:MAG: AAA family ATPase [Bacteroidetes bacterium]|nr:AAA family ATPase [Bacteroidota bacterium]
MIFVDRNSINVPKVFSSNELHIAQKRLDDFYNRPKSKRSQERYSRAFEPELRDQFISSLEKLFNGKCAYCESLINKVTSNRTYDHFRPKHSARGLEKEFSSDHYWWLTYEWNNLYYSCEICNRYKASWFPVDGDRVKAQTQYKQIIVQEKPLLVDPCNDKPEEHLIYLEDGEVDFLTPRGKTTIEVLKLNRKELLEARKSVLKALSLDCENMLNLWRAKKKSRNKIKTIALKWEELYSGYSKEPYIAIQRQLLSNWLGTHTEIQSYLANKEYESLGVVYKTEIDLSQDILKEIQSFDKSFLKEQEKIEIGESLKLDDLKHVYIDKIELKNFKCFDDITINLSNDDGSSFKSEPWILFLGENGVGKSSILKAITIALCGENYFPKLKLIPSNLLKRGKKDGFIKLFLKGEEKPIEVKFDNEKITTSIKYPKANLVGYGSIRLLPKEKTLLPEKSNQAGVKAQNLFDYSVSLINADKWLLDRTQKDFDLAALTLKDLMLLEQDAVLKRDLDKGKIFIKNATSPIYIDELSDGYQSVYALVVDIMASFRSEKISYDVAEGIVLIDEIGTHLHPRWKMEAVSQLRRAFPKMQFIVTTHEPLCLRGLRQGEVSVLTKDKDKNVYSISDLPDPSELRVDQILTSEFFGLKSTIDPQTERLFDEYYAILALDEKDRSGDQKNRLLELNELVPRIKHLGDNLREELVYYVIDELLARKTREDGLKISQELKAEAIKRVDSLWKSINK